MEWYVQVLRKYAVFDGRARRKEYRMLFLYSFLFAFATALFLPPPTPRPRANRWAR